MSSQKQDAKDLIASMDVGEWSLSDEREFTEGLFTGRFDFFLVVFSIFVTAGFANAFTTLRPIVFYAGAALLLMVWLTLLRAFRKHDRLLRVIFRDKPEHPACQLEALMKIEGYKPNYRVS